MEAAEAAPTEAHVWAWLPRASAPVVVGLLEQQRGGVITFTYGPQYLARDDAISLYEPELPVRPGRLEPPTGLSVASAIRDAAPDAWGQRVILARHQGQLTRQSDTADLGLLTYLLESGSNRVGALDFQASSSMYVPREVAASLPDLSSAADALEAGGTLPEELAETLVAGAGVGGARPKALLEDDGRPLVAKFSSATDNYPVVRAEALGMILARAAGLEVPDVEVTSGQGRDVLLVERFDRAGLGPRRRMMVSGLTMLGLDEMFARYATYTDLAALIQRRFTNPEGTLEQLFRRIAFNIAIGNTDDHARNHAAFWDGTSLTLTPAYDLCPQPRVGWEANQAMAFGESGERQSRLPLLRACAAVYALTDRDAGAIIDDVVESVRSSFAGAADQARLSSVEAEQFWGRQVLNAYAFQEE